MEFFLGVQTQLHIEKISKRRLKKYFPTKKIHATVNWKNVCQKPAGTEDEWMNGRVSTRQLGQNRSKDWNKFPRWKEWHCGFSLLQIFRRRWFGWRLFDWSKPFDLLLFSVLCWDPPATYSLRGLRRERLDSLEGCGSLTVGPRGPAGQRQPCILSLSTRSWGQSLSWGDVLVCWHFSWLSLKVWALWRETFG